MAPTADKMYCLGVWLVEVVVYMLRAAASSLGERSLYQSTHDEQSGFSDHFRSFNLKLEIIICTIWRKFKSEFKWEGIYFDTYIDNYLCILNAKLSIIYRRIIINQSYNVPALNSSQGPNSLSELNISATLYFSYSHSWSGSRSCQRK